MTPKARPQKSYKQLRLSYKKLQNVTKSYKKLRLGYQKVTEELRKVMKITNELPNNFL